MIRKGYDFQIFLFLTKFSCEFIRIYVLANVNIHWRSEESAKDTASAIYATKEFLKYHQEIEILGLIQCTSPFINKKFVLRAVHLMKNEQCVFSVTK